MQLITSQKGLRSKGNLNSTVTLKLPGKKSTCALCNSVQLSRDSLHKQTHAKYTSQLSQWYTAVHQYTQRKKHWDSCCCSKPDLSHQCVTYIRTMHTHAHKHSSAVEVIFCFSVLNPSPVSPSLQYPLLFALQSPLRLLCYHPSMSLILSPNQSLPSSLPFPLIKKNLCPPSFMF